MRDQLIKDIESGVLRRKLEMPVANWVGKHLVSTSNQTLVELRLDNLALSNFICDVLGEFLAQPTCRLQKLSMLGTNINVNAFDTWSIDAGKITYAGIYTLLSGVMLNSSLLELEVPELKIGPHGAGLIADMLISNCTLTSLNLSSNWLAKAAHAKDVYPAGGPVAIAQALRRNYQLRQLSFRRCDLASESLQPILRALASNIGLTDLDLSENAWDSGSLAMVDASLEKNLSVVKLAVGSDQRRVIERPALDPYNALVMAQQKVFRLNLSNLSFNRGLWSNLFTAHTDLMCYRLQELILPGNEFRTFPLEIFRLKKITRLSLARNGIKAVPPEIGALTTLTEIDLSHNSISELPQHMVQLQNLRKIWLTHNAFSVFPTLLTLITAIKSLDLRNNRLRSLPSTFTWPNIKHLYLQFNQMDTLPTTISTMTSLKEIWLAHNRLDFLPTEFRFRLLHDEDLVSVWLLRGNQLDEDEMLKNPGVDLKVAAKGIRQYLERMEQQAPQFAQVKLICVGEGNVGKSTLINALASMATITSPRKVFALPKKEEKKDKGGNLATDGIEISSFTLDNAWDFAGQDAYHVPHQLFLSSRAIYLVPFNLAAGLGAGSLSEEVFLSLPHIQALRFWLASIAARVEDAEVLIVGTHADEPMIQQNPDLLKFVQTIVLKLQKSFPIVAGFQAVSVTKRIGLDDLRRKLAEMTSSPKLKIVKGLPVNVYLLLESVRRLRRRYEEATTAPMMTWREFEHLVLRHNINATKIKEIAEYLASIGELGYFPEEEWSQKNHVFLDPQWVVNTMRTIFTLKHNLAKNGRIYIADLKLVWKPPEYPDAIHATLLQLLEKFEVLYVHPLEAPDPNRGQCYLVPAFLPATGNAFSLLWPRIYAGVELGRLYKMQFVPPGFFSRLTIRLLHYAKVQGMWSDGIVISDKDASALVRIVPPFTLRVSVRSSASTPVRLLRLILNTIDTLLNYWYKVGVEKFVPCTHCVIAGLQPFMFPTTACEEAAAKGVVLLTCVSGAKVRLDSLMPDLVMGDLKRALIIFKEIELQKQLGQGAFGIIHKGVYRGETVAVKLLKFEEDSRVQAFNEFRSEVILMSALTHPNVVGLRGYCEEPYAMVMECVSCGDLYRFLHDPQSDSSWRLRLRMALDIALGMRFLHSLTPPLIHRDLKSPNILLAAVSADAPVVAKVADFGLSTILFNNALREDAKTRAVANPTWLAPEVTKGNSYSEKSDVYAFGVITHEIMTRKHPFEEFNFKLLYLLEEAVQKGVRPSIHFQFDKEAPGFCQLIREAWHNEPDKRPTFDQIALRLLEQIPLLAPGLVIPKVQLRHNEKTEVANISERAVADGRLLQRLSTSQNASRSRTISSLCVVAAQIWAGTKEGALLMYSAENGELVEEDPKAHAAEIKDIKMLRSYVFTGAPDGVIKVWQPKSLDTAPHMQQLQTKEGWLNKEGASNKTWQKRWFKLRTDFILEYSKSQNQKGPQVKTLPLREAKLTRVEGDKKYVIIALQPANSARSFQFRWKAEERSDADEWINLIKKAILLSDPALEKQNLFVQTFTVGFPISFLTFELDQFLVCGPQYKVGACPIREPTRPYKIDTVVTVNHPSLPMPGAPFSAIYSAHNTLWAVAETVIVALSPNLKPAGKFLDVRSHITASARVNDHIWTGDRQGFLRAWALDKAQCLATVPTGMPGLSCMSATTWAVWCCSFDGSSVVLDAETREVLKRPNKEHSGQIVAVQISYGRIVWTAGSDQTMNVWVLTA